MKYSNEVLQAAIDAAKGEEQALVVNEPPQNERQPDLSGESEKQTDEAAIKSSQIGILRPLSEAGPVPDGCVRVTAFNRPEDDYWAIGDLDSEQDTHFADIRIPSTETPAIEAADPFAELKAAHEGGKQIQILNPEINPIWIDALNPSWDSRFQYRIKPEPADPYARLKAYAKAGARIRVRDPFGWSDWKTNHHWSWVQPVKHYEVFPPDLQMVPEYAPHDSLNGLTREEEAMTASVAGLTKAMSHPGVSDVEQFHGRSSDLDKAQDELRYISETFDAMGIPSVSDDGQSLSCKQRADMVLTKLAASKALTKLAASKALTKLAASKAPRQECVLQLLAEAGPVPAGCARVTAFQRSGSNQWLIGNTLSTRDTHFIDVKLPGAASPYATDQTAPTGATDQTARIQELENRLREIRHLTQSVSS